MLEDPDGSPGYSIAALALRRACENRNAPVVQEIVSHESCPCSRSFFFCPLHLAIEINEKLVIFTILEHKAWAYIQSSLHKYFSEARERQERWDDDEVDIDFDIVKKLVEAGAYINFGLKPPIQYAIDCDCEDVACYLLEQGADISYHSPFDNAMKHGFTKLVQKMIEKNVPLHNLDPYEYLYRLSDSDGSMLDHFECLVRFDRYSYPQYTKRPLIITMFDDPNCDFDSKIDLLKLLFSTSFGEIQYDVNVNPEDDGTALYYAALEGNRHCVEFLLQKGAEVHYMSENKQVSILEQLLNYLSSVEFWGSSAGMKCISKEVFQQKWIEVDNYTNIKQIIDLLLDAGSQFPDETELFFHHGIHKYHRSNINNLTTKVDNLIDGIPEWCAYFASPHPSKRRKV